MGWMPLMGFERRAQFVEEVGLGPMQEAAREPQAGAGDSCRRTGTGSQGPATCLSRSSVSAASEAWMLRKQGAPGDAGQSGLGLALPSLQTPGQDHLRGPRGPILGPEVEGTHRVRPFCYSLQPRFRTQHADE